MTNHGSLLSTALHKLERHGRLTESDRQAFLALPVMKTRVRSGAYLVREGDRPAECALLLSGYAYRHKATECGERQIVSLHLRGDIVDLQHLMLPKADHSVQTLTDADICKIPLAALRQLARDYPGISQALWLDSLIDASIFREWVLNVGRRDATTRIAHLLCEFGVRWQSAGLGPADNFELPMTQEQLADATGLTPVHVTRVLQNLGASGLIDRDRRKIAVRDWGLLQRTAGFTPDYLHQESHASV